MKDEKNKVLFAARSVWVAHIGRAISPREEDEKQKQRPLPYTLSSSPTLFCTVQYLIPISPLISYDDELSSDSTHCPLGNAPTTDVLYYCIVLYAVDG